MKTYKFTCVDHDDDSKTTVEFTTEDEAWSGYNGPMWMFYNFLKGCGYIFDINSELGILDDAGEFHPAHGEL